jgi:hypothetical protein
VERLLVAFDRARTSPHPSPDVHCCGQSTTDQKDDEQRLHLCSLTLFIRFAFKHYGTYQMLWRMVGGRAVVAVGYGAPHMGFSLHMAAE